jgi:hypothetical protein
MPAGRPRRLALALAAVAIGGVTLAGCDSWLALLSGITGVVMLGPTCDAPTPADPCLQAYSARLVVFDPDGRVVGDVSSSADGSFRLTLPPGDYVIQPAPGGDPFPRAEARNVTVVEGEMSQVEIDYETRDRADAPSG